MDGYGELVRRRRGILGLTQRALAERAGIKQPLVAAIERGHRVPSAATRAALDVALAMRPSVALDARREEVLALFRRAGLGEPRVFGSVARGEDGPSSDIDLVVPFGDDHDIVDLLDLETELAKLLTVHVDVIDARATGDVAARAQAESVAL